MLKIASSEKFEGYNRESEPSSVCLARMVQGFIEGTMADNSNNKFFLSSVSSYGYLEDDSERFAANSVESCEVLTSLVVCSSVCERNLLDETVWIVEKNKRLFGRRDDDGLLRKIVVDGLLAIGYDASLCKSRWEKSSSSFPVPGEHEYIDVIVNGERIIVDVDFRSEFEIARPTKAYKTIIHTLPRVFVGKSERLQRIVSVVSEAAKQSLNKRGMPVPPWRKLDYVSSKWLSPHTRVGAHTCEPISSIGHFEQKTTMVVDVNRKLYYGFKIKKIKKSVSISPESDFANNLNF